MKSKSKSNDHPSIAARAPTGANAADFVLNGPPPAASSNVVHQQEGVGVGEQQPKNNETNIPFPRDYRKDGLGSKKARGGDHANTPTATTSGASFATKTSGVGLSNRSRATNAGAVAVRGGEDGVVGDGEEVAGLSKKNANKMSSKTDARATGTNTTLAPATINTADAAVLHEGPEKDYLDVLEKEEEIVLATTITTTTIGNNNNSTDGALFDERNCGNDNITTWDDPKTTSAGHAGACDSFTTGVPFPKNYRKDGLGTSLKQLEKEKKQARGGRGRGEENAPTGVGLSKKNANHKINNNRSTRAGAIAIDGGNGAISSSQQQHREGLRRNVENRQAKIDTLTSGGGGGTRGDVATTTNAPSSNQERSSQRQHEGLQRSLEDRQTKINPLIRRGTGLIGAVEGDAAAAIATTTTTANDKGNIIQATLDWNNQSSCHGTTAESDTVVAVARGSTSDDRGKIKIAKLEAATGRRRSNATIATTAGATGTSAAIGHKTNRNKTTNHKTNDALSCDAVATASTTSTDIPSLRGLSKNEAPNSRQRHQQQPQARTLRGLRKNNDAHRSEKINNDNDDDEEQQASSPTATSPPPSPTAAPSPPSPAASPPSMLQRGDTGLLAVARAIEDESSPADLTEAKEVDEAELERRVVEKKKNRECVIIGFFLMAVSIAILALASVLGTRKRNNSSSKKEIIDTTVTISPMPTSASPSMVPSSAPSTALDLVKAYLPIETLVRMQTFGTPQYRAGEWLSEHPNVTDFQEWKIQQLFALATFYYAFEGDHWNPLIRQRWMKYNKDECLWYTSALGSFDGYGKYTPGPPSFDASSCDEGEEFPSLTLESLQLPPLLAPSIPPQIALLTALSAINLGANNIEASLFDILPTELELLSNFRQLVLYSNALHGPLPSELGLLTSPTTLSFQNNALTGPLPSELGLLTSLEHLHLHGNDLNGPLPSELGMMTSLKALWVGNNDLTGPLPSELGLMTDLLKLTLVNNALTGPLPSELGMLKSLQHLRVENNALTGPLPSEMGRMTSLRSLTADNNALTGPLPSGLGLMTRIGRTHVFVEQCTPSACGGFRCINGARC